MLKREQSSMTPTELLELTIKMRDEGASEFSFDNVYVKFDPSHPKCQAPQGKVATEAVVVDGVRADRIDADTFFDTKKTSLEDDDATLYWSAT